MRTLKTFNMLFVATFFLELLLFAAIELLIPSSEESKPLAILIAKGIPKDLIILVSFLITLKYFADSNLIHTTMQMLKKEYPWAKGFLVPPSRLIQVIAAILLMLTQYSVVLINWYWGLFVQLTIYVYAISRVISSKEENLRQMLGDIKKAGIDNPIVIFVGCYRLKLYCLAVLLIGSDFFIAFVSFHSRVFGVVHERYDFILLYLFVSFLGSILFSLMLIPGFYYAKKNKNGVTH